MTATPFVTEDGTRLALWRDGEGPPLLFQHGLCGDARQTRAVFPQDVDHSCWTLEMRGHGGSEPGDPARFSISRFADDLISLLAREARGPLVLGGISMGAALALRVAVREPGRVRGLVLMRPAWLFDAAPANMAPNAEVGALLSQYPPAEARRRFLASATAERLRSEAPDNLASLEGFFAREPAAVTAALLSRIAADGPGVDHRQVAALRVPCLVIGHERDAIHPLDYARRLAGVIPGARLVEVTPKADSTDRYANDVRDALKAFLSRLG